MYFEQVTASALEIDFGALAASLNCVPLHKRLDISADGIHVCILNTVLLLICGKDCCCYRVRCNLLYYCLSQDVVTLQSTSQVTAL